MIEICLFQPSVPSNLGSIIRTASCFSISTIHIIMPTTFPIELKKLKNTSLDYGQEINFLKHANFQDFFTFANNNQFEIVLLTTKTKNIYYNHKFQEKTILLSGNESYGVSDEVRDCVKNTVTIPMASTGRSLNVATSVAIVVSEAMRQYSNNIL